MRRPRKLLYSYGKAAEAMGVGRERIISMVQDGLIGVCMVQDKPMIPLESLQEYIRNHTVTVIPNQRRTPQPTRRPEGENFFYCKICNGFSIREPERYYAVDVCPGCNRLKKNKAAIEELKAKKYQAIKEARVS